mgnify:FL=1
MKNKKIAALLGILLAGSMAFSLSACGNSSDSAASDKSSTSTSDTKKADDSSDSAGFEEIQVDEKHSDQECGPLTVNAVYFQPIDMEPPRPTSWPSW